MKKGVFALMLFLAMSVISCKESKKETTEPKETEVKAIVKEVIAATTYQCPMKCEKEKTYTKEGSCPVCKMDLKEVKKTVEHESHEGHDH